MESWGSKMKLSGKLSFLLFIFVLFIPSVYGETVLSLDCPSSSVGNSTINCGVLATSDIELSAVSTKLKLSSNLEFVRFTTDASWQGIGDNGNIDLYTYPNQKGEIKLGVATIKVLNDKGRTGTISLENTTVYKSDFSGVVLNNFSKNIKILSGNNNLSALTFDKGSLTPKFSKDTLKYTLTVDSDTVLIQATAEDENARISGIGVKELQYGENNFIITVTSEAGSKKEYSISITRLNNQDNSSDKENGDSSVKGDDKVQVPPIKEEKKNTDVDASKNENSKEEVKVLPTLKALIIEGYSIDFKENVYTYSIDLLKQEKELRIQAIPMDEKTKVTILGNNNLITGANEIIITLENTDGEKNTYKIIASKKGDICLVKKIRIENYSFKFNCSQYEYELKIKDEDHLNIDVIPIDKNTKINISHNNHLKSGDTITISVDKDGSVSQYLIKILKEDKENTSIIASQKSVIVIGIGILLLGYFMGRVIIKRVLAKKNKI